MSDHVDCSALPIRDPTFTGRRGGRRGPPSAAEADNAGSAVRARPSQAVPCLGRAADRSRWQRSARNRPPQPLRGPPQISHRCKDHGDSPRPVTHRGRSSRGRKRRHLWLRTNTPVRQDRACRPSQASNQTTGAPSHSTASTVADPARTRSRLCRQAGDCSNSR
jgi:hypothetical protein